MIQFTHSMIDLKNSAKYLIAMSLALVLTVTQLTTVFAQSEAQSVFGTVQAPPGVDKYNAGAEGGIGLINFLSAGIRLVTIVAGLYVFLNLITAGYDYISAGDSKAHQAVKDKVTMSVLGLIIIVVSYTIIALISYILFGDPSYILSPTVVGPVRG
jgi:hypothetical protein